MKKTQATRDMSVMALILSLVIVLPSCASLSLEQVNYSWPVESVLVVKDDNTVLEGRHAMKFNIAPLAETEFENANALKGREIRLLRSNEGMYYVTGTNFKHVYVMAPVASELKLYTKYEVSKTGLMKPALNQRDPYVELVDGSTLRVLMTGDELFEGQDLRAEGQK